MIDTAARNVLQQRALTKQVTDRLDNLGGNIQQQMNNKDYGPLLEYALKQLKQIESVLTQETNGKIDELSQSFKKSELNTEQFQGLKRLVDDINSKMAVFEGIKEKIDAGQTIIFPKETQLSGKVDIGRIEQPLEVTVKNPTKVVIPDKTTVTGRVDVGSVDNLPAISVSNLGEISQSLSSMISELNNSIYAAMKAMKVEVPKEFKISKPVEVVNFQDLLESIEELKKGIQLLVNKEGADGPAEVTVTNFPIQKVPTPVTHMSINALNGFINTTAATVTSALTPLPTYGVLANRRSMIVYNNSSNTIYVGGSDVTTSSGLPVPANSYSPPFDTGVRTILYGIAASGNNNVRVMEISDINSGM